MKRQTETTTYVCRQCKAPISLDSATRCPDPIEGAPGNGTRVCSRKCAKVYGKGRK